MMIDDHLIIGGADEAFRDKDEKNETSDERRDYESNASLRSLTLDGSLSSKALKPLQITAKYASLSKWDATKQSPESEVAYFIVVQNVILRESLLMKFKIIAENLDLQYWKYVILRLKVSAKQQSMKVESAVAKRNVIRSLQTQLTVALAHIRGSSISVIESVNSWRNTKTSSGSIKTKETVSIYWEDENYLLKMSTDIRDLCGKYYTVRLWLGFHPSSLILPPLDPVQKHSYNVLFSRNRSTSAVPHTSSRSFSVGSPVFHRNLSNHSQSPVRGYLSPENNGNSARNGLNSLSSNSAEYMLPSHPESSVFDAKTVWQNQHFNHFLLWNKMRQDKQWETERQKRLILPGGPEGDAITEAPTPDVSISSLYLSPLFPANNIRQLFTPGTPDYVIFPEIHPTQLPKNSMKELRNKLKNKAESLSTSDPRVEEEIQPQKIKSFKELSFFYSDFEAAALVPGVLSGSAELFPENSTNVSDLCVGPESGIESSSDVGVAGSSDGAGGGVRVDQVHSIGTPAHLCSGTDGINSSTDTLSSAPLFHGHDPLQQHTLSHPHSTPPPLHVPSGCGAFPSSFLSFPLSSATQIGRPSPCKPIETPDPECNGPLGCVGSSDRIGGLTPVRSPSPSIRSYTPGGSKMSGTLIWGPSPSGDKGENDFLWDDSFGEERSTNTPLQGYGESRSSSRKASRRMYMVQGTVRDFPLEIDQIFSDSEQWISVLRSLCMSSWGVEQKEGGKEGAKEDDGEGVGEGEVEGDLEGDVGRSNSSDDSVTHSKQNILRNSVVQNIPRNNAIRTPDKCKNTLALSLPDNLAKSALSTELSAASVASSMPPTPSPHTTPPLEQGLANVRQFWGNLLLNPVLTEAAVGFSEIYPRQPLVPTLPSKLYKYCKTLEKMISEEIRMCSALSELAEKAGILKGEIENTVLIEVVRAMTSDGNKSKILLQQEILKMRMKAISVTPEYSSEQKDSFHPSGNVPVRSPTSHFPILNVPISPKKLFGEAEPEDTGTSGAAGEINRKMGGRKEDIRDAEGFMERDGSVERRGSSGVGEGDTFITGISVGSTDKQTDTRRPYPSVSFLFSSDAKHSSITEECSLTSYHRSMGFEEDGRGKLLDGASGTRSLFNPKKMGIGDGPSAREKRRNSHFILRMNSKTLEGLVTRRVEDSRRVVRRVGSEVCVRLEANGRRLQIAHTQVWAELCAVLIQKHVRGFLARLRVMIVRNEGAVFRKVLLMQRIFRGAIGRLKVKNERLLFRKRMFYIRNKILKKQRSAFIVLKFIRKVVEIVRAEKRSRLDYHEKYRQLMVEEKAEKEKREEREERRRLEQEILEEMERVEKEKRDAEKLAADKRFQQQIIDDTGRSGFVDWKHPTFRFQTQVLEPRSPHPTTTPPKPTPQNPNPAHSQDILLPSFLTPPHPQSDLSFPFPSPFPSLKNTDSQDNSNPRKSLNSSPIQMRMTPEALGYKEKRIISSDDCIRTHIRDGNTHTSPRADPSYQPSLDNSDDDDVNDLKEMNHNNNNSNYHNSSNNNNNNSISGSTSSSSCNNNNNNNNSSSTSSSSSSSSTSSSSNGARINPITLLSQADPVLPTHSITPQHTHAHTHTHTRTKNTPHTNYPTQSEKALKSNHNTSLLKNWARPSKEDSRNIRSFVPLRIPDKKQINRITKKPGSNEIDKSAKLEHRIPPKLALESREVCVAVAVAVAIAGRESSKLTIREKIETLLRDRGPSSPPSQDTRSTKRINSSFLRNSGKFSEADASQKSTNNGAQGPGVPSTKDTGVVVVGTLDLPDTFGARNPGVMTSGARNSLYLGGDRPESPGLNGVLLGGSSKNGVQSPGVNSFARRISVQEKIAFDEQLFIRKLSRFKSGKSDGRNIILPLDDQPFSAGHGQLTPLSRNNIRPNTDGPPLPSFPSSLFSTHSIPSSASFLTPIPNPIPNSHTHNDRENTNNHHRNKGQNDMSNVRNARTSCHFLPTLLSAEGQSSNNDGNTSDSIGESNSTNSQHTRQKLRDTKDEKKNAKIDAKVSHFSAFNSTSQDSLHEKHEKHDGKNLRSHREERERERDEMEPSDTILNILKLSLQSTSQE